MKILKNLAFLSIGLLLFLTSCKAKIYQTDDLDEFTNIYYDYLINEKTDFCAIDLRSKENYANGHFKGFVLYNYYLTSQNETKEEYAQRISDAFLKYIERNYDKTITIFLVSDDLKVLEKECQNLKKRGFKKIISYYGEVKKTQKIEIITGDDDCNC